jgi:hypothetical protein
MSEPLDEDTAPGRSRAPWERPTLTELGDVKDLIRGSGKVSGAPNDSDPTSTRKSPGLG